MAVIKKKIKHVESNNMYLPHKIRSHPFYFINLPLKAILFFIFYWIVLTPLLYFIFLTYLPGFAAASLPYFLVMFAVFLLIMGIFVGEWRMKKHMLNKEVYYIKYETPDSVDNLEKQVEKPLTDVEQQPEEEVILRKKSREMIFLSDRRQNIEHQRSILIEEIKEKIYQRESKQPAERPTDLQIEENIRPVSHSPLTPRELFFLDMYEYANKAMRDVTADFIKKESQYYVVSGPVSRSYSSSDSSTDTQVIESFSLDQYPKYEQSSSSQHYERGKHLEDEKYPTGVRYTIREHQIKESHSPMASDHSNLLQVLEKLSADNKNDSLHDRFEAKEVENENYPNIREQCITSEQYPIQQQPEDRQSVINKSVPNYDLNILKVLKEYSNDKDRKFGSRGRIEVKEVKKEREYYIANVVPRESCVSEAFLYVDETKSDKKPLQLIAQLRKSS